MKIQFFKQGSLGLMVALAPLVGGCNPQPDSSSQGLVALAFAEPAQAVAESNGPPAAPVSATPAAPAEKVEAVPATLDEKPLPPGINANGPVAEVIKLAQAGVDEGVMLTFITNSTSTFGLGSEEIIYLNDIGVPNNVVTTMIEHDQATKQFWANAAQAQAATAAPPPAAEPADQTAAAPSYVNPPQAAPAEPQPTIVNNNYFYDTLSPYGSWVNVEGYGLCWQPTAVVLNRGWQPYGDRGHWVYTDSGWYWLSDYSWGATTFHYGRWFSHPRWGWCWWPDRVWAPSWVTWRYSGDYCGWAPLPPFAYYQPGFGFSFHGRSVGFGFDFGIGASWYTFVPVSRFCDPHPYRHRLPSHRVTQVFNKTTIINNFGTGSHNRVINHGIAPDRISSVTKQEIRRVSIRDAGPAFAAGSRHERLDPEGRTLTVHRPNIPQDRTGPRRTTSTTVNSGKASPYAPYQTTRDARDKSLQANPTASSQNQREEPRSVKIRPAGTEDRISTGSPGRVAPAGNPPTTIGSRPSPTSRTMPTPSPKSDSPPTRSSKPDDSQRGKGRGPGPSSTVPPLNVGGSQVTSASSPAAPAPGKATTPPSSITVIGKQDSPSQRRGTSVAPAPQTRVAELEARDMQTRTTFPGAAAQTPNTRPPATRNQFSPPTVPSQPSPRATAPARTYNWSPGASQNTPRQEIPKTTRSVEPGNISRPSYSAPAPVQRPAAPSYTPPVAAPAPAPRYDRTPTYSPPPNSQQSAPRSAPAPSYSPPRSAPAPSYSPPASQAPAPRAQPTPSSRSDSGGPKGRNQ